MREAEERVPAGELLAAEEFAVRWWIESSVLRATCSLVWISCPLALSLSLLLDNYSDRRLPSPPHPLLRFWQAASDCPDVTFLRLVGDGSKDAEALCARLGITKLPTLQFYRNGNLLWQKIGVDGATNDLGEVSACVSPAELRGHVGGGSECRPLFVCAFAGPVLLQGVLFFGQVGAGGIKSTEHIPDLKSAWIFREAPDGFWGARRDLSRRIAFPPPGGVLFKPLPHAAFSRTPCCCRHQGCAGLPHECGPRPARRRDGGTLQGHLVHPYVSALFAECGFFSFLVLQPCRLLTAFPTSSPPPSPSPRSFPSALALARNMTGHVAFARLLGDDGEDALNALKALGVSQVPTFIFFRNGKETGRHIGSSKGDLVGQLMIQQGISFSLSSLPARAAPQPRRMPRPPSYRISA